MRHFVDLYALFPPAPVPAIGNTKEVGCNDFYLTREGKFGTLQSFGRMPPSVVALEDLRREVEQAAGTFCAGLLDLLRPITGPVIDRIFARATVMASIMEDLPYASNRILPPAPGRTGIALSYSVAPHEERRIAELRGKVRGAFGALRHFIIKQAENNQRIAHVCGTCRFGRDPESSVLDADNRAHDLDNLYIVDASFFPSSGGTNPALTIAANALRVAESMLARRSAE
jgi:choline dehydrogenase-like flavoprotein